MVGWWGGGDGGVGSDPSSFVVVGGGDVGGIVGIKMERNARTFVCRGQPTASTPNPINQATKPIHTPNPFNTINQLPSTHRIPLTQSTNYLPRVQVIPRQGAGEGRVRPEEVRAEPGLGALVEGQLEGAEGDVAEEEACFVFFVGFWCVCVCGGVWGVKGWCCWVGGGRTLDRSIDRPSPPPSIHPSIHAFTGQPKPSPQTPSTGHRKPSNSTNKRTGRTAIALVEAAEPAALPPALHDGRAQRCPG